MRFVHTGKPKPGSGEWNEAALLPAVDGQNTAAIIGDAMFEFGGLHYEAHVWTCVGAACAVAPTPAPIAAPTSSPTPKTFPVAGTVAIALGCTALFCFCVWRRRQPTKRQVEELRSKSSWVQRLLEDKEQEFNKTVEAAQRDVRTLQEAWRIHPSDLTLDAFVAAGGEGRVYRATWRGHIECAMKLMRRDPDREAEWGFSNAEVKAMQRLRGSRLVHFYGLGDCVLDDEASEGASSSLPVVRAIREGEAEDAVVVWDFVVLELMASGSLRDLLERKAAAGETWAWSDRLRALRDVAEGMAQMHAKRYIHRDLPVELLQNTVSP